MAPQTATRMTYEEFMALPGEEGKHYELIEGELVVNPAPLVKHQRIVRKLLTALDRYFEERGGGEVLCAPLDVALSPDNVLEPDLIVILSDRLPLLGAANMQGPPNIAVEVLSEGTRRRDVVVKRRLYETFGVDEYWIVDPEIDTVRIYRRGGASFERAIEISTDSGGNITSPLLPGFALDVNHVFAE